jgi:hypothetical protein
VKRPEGTEDMSIVDQWQPSWRRGAHHAHPGDRDAVRTMESMLGGCLSGRFGEELKSKVVFSLSRRRGCLSAVQAARPL